MRVRKASHTPSRETFLYCSTERERSFQRPQGCMQAGLAWFKSTGNKMCGSGGEHQRQLLRSGRAQRSPRHV